MAELPEVETLRHDLEREVAGKKMKTVEFTGMKCLAKHQNRKQVISLLEGAKISTVRRRALLLVFKLANDHLLVIDAVDHGHIRKAAAKEPIEPHTQAIFSFTQGPQLRVVDPSEGGLQMAVVPAGEFDEQFPQAVEAGSDVVSTPMSWMVFAKMIRNSDAKLKALLTDPTQLVGIGEMYSDEILWDAGLKAERIASRLSTQEERRLHRSIVEIIHDAIKHRGTSLGDDPFLDLAGQPGGYGEFLKVYGRAGEVCGRCRNTIVKHKVAKLVTFGCPVCQV